MPSPMSDNERDLVACALGLHERARLAGEHPGWVEARPDEPDLALGRLTLPEPFPAPGWLVVLREVLGEMAATLPTEGLLPLAPVRPAGELVMQHYWDPWIRVATRRLEATAGPLWAELAPSVKLTLQVELLEDLALCGRSCLMHELGKDRSTRISAVDLVGLVADASPPREIYTACVRRLLGGGAWAFWAEYPVVARQAAVLLGLWVDRVAELLHRLQADRPVLAERFAGGKPLGPLVRVQPRLSDPHNHGRRVMLLELEPALRLVYKPRRVTAEHHWNDLLRWCASLEGGPRLPLLEVCDRGEHGWVEAIDEDQPRQPDEAYLERVGELLALVHLLQGTDCHLDNVLRLGDDPVLVDLETMVTPAAAEVLDSVDRWLVDSVLRTGLLPTELDPARDLSPLAGPPRQVSPPRFVHINTDGMYPVDESDDAPADPERPWAVAEPVCRGFRRAHGFLCAHRDELQAEDGPLAAFRSLSARLVLRETAAYTGALHASRAPEFMRSGAAFGRRLEDRLASPPLPAPLLGLEHEALLRGDIPRFEVPVDGTTVRAGGGVVEGLIEEPGWQRLQRALRALSPRERERQVQCIACALPSVRNSPGETLEEPPSPARVRDAGLGLLRRLAELAIAEEGAASWIGRHVDPSFLVGEVGADLYAGRAGIALALAGAHAVSGDPELRRAALAALQRTRVEARADPGRVVRQQGIGAFVGVGGQIYVLAQVARLVDEPPLLADARLLLGAIDRDAIAGDRELDVIGGVAGLILALRTLAGQSWFAEAVDVVSECAQHLLRTARPQARGIAWVFEDLGRPLCGMSHGNAGFALALAEAARVVGDPALSSAARAALDWERDQRDDRRGNWPDWRSPEPAWPTAWCHGAPGIALARFCLSRIEENADVSEDLDLALTTTRAARSESWSLCCGVAGIQDILLEIGRGSSDPAVLHEARARAGALVRLVEDAGDGLPPGLLARPGLMTGLAGIGYALLRLESELPSVLCLEA